MYTPRRTKLQFKTILEEDPVPIASALQCHIYIIQIFIYLLLRERSRKMCSKTHQIAQRCVVHHFMPFEAKGVLYAWGHVQPANAPYTNYLWLGW